MRGYKGFDSDWTCRGFKYKVGETYEIDGELSLCHRGFHFCKKLEDVFSYYPHGVYAEIEALGDIIEDEIEYASKCVTNKIKIVREISKEEIAELANHGKDNTGRCNFGNKNSGDDNHGDENTGSDNYGNNNSGYGNYGNTNNGQRNYGWSNDGGHNYGTRNSGHRNYGDNNYGYSNYGNANHGDCNYGHSNLGSYNYGTGNTGFCCFGDFNTCSDVIGCFNTKKINKGVQFFNKAADIEMFSWIQSEARQILSKVPYDIKMRTAWWESLDDNEKRRIYEIPNFRLDMFCAILNINTQSREWHKYLQDFQKIYRSIKVERDIDSKEKVDRQTFQEVDGEKKVICTFNYSYNYCIIMTEDGTLLGQSQVLLTEEMERDKLIGLAWRMYEENEAVRKEEESNEKKESE